MKPYLEFAGDLKMMLLVANGRDTNSMGPAKSLDSTGRTGQQRLWEGVRAGSTCPRHPGSTCNSYPYGV